MGDPKLIDLACELRHETDKAFLIFDGAREVWIPKSLAEWEPAPNRSSSSSTGTITMPEWLAQREGLI